MYISVSLINGLYFTFVWVFSRLYCYQQDLVCLLFLTLNLSGFNTSFVKCGSYESCRIAGYTPDLRREEVEDSLRLALTEVERVQKYSTQVKVPLHYWNFT